MMAEDLLAPWWVSHETPAPSDGEDRDEEE